MKSKNIEEGYQILVDTDVAAGVTESHFVDDALAYTRGRIELVALESVRYGIWLASTNIKERIEADDARFEDVKWLLDREYEELEENFVRFYYKIPVGSANYVRCDYRK